MKKARLINIREEGPQEAALRQWFDAQALAAPDTLEAAARLLIGLITGLLTLLFGVLAVAEDPLPGYLACWGMRGLGVVCVVALLVALVAALGVVLPRRIETAANRAAEQARAFAEMVRRKANRLRAAVVAFGLGVGALGVALVAALLLA